MRVPQEPAKLAQSMSGAISVLDSRFTKLLHIPAIRRKCDCKSGLVTSPANCLQSAARRKHSRSCFRRNSDSDIAYRLQISTVNDRTTPRVLSVAYATKKRK